MEGVKVENDSVKVVVFGWVRRFLIESVMECVDWCIVGMKNLLILKL